MSNRNKSPKKRNKKRTFRPNKDKWTNHNAINIEDVLGDILLKSTDGSKNIQTYDTPFGKLSVGEDVEMNELTNKRLFLDILAMEDTEGDPLNQLIAFEKLKDKYPNEPYIYQEIAHAHRRLGYDKEFEEEAENNYHRFKGNFSIDLNYFEFLYNQTEIAEKEKIKKKIFGESLNLHQIYPTVKTFEGHSVFKFYSMMGISFLNNKEYQLAKDCNAIIQAIQPDTDDKMETMIRLREDSIYRYKQYAIFGGLILLIIAVIGSVIYGIVKFFQWIF